MGKTSGYKLFDLIYEFFDNSHFKEFFDLNDANVLQWSLTVMEKLYSSGIMPSYIERNSGNDNLFEDEDFIAFWLSKCHFFGLLVIYVRFFENIEQNDVLKQLFLDNLGLYYAIDQSSTDLDYIFNNYLDEIKNRGTISVASKKGENGNQVDGELLRIINYKTFNEYVFAPLAKKEIGWNIGNSSPLFRGTQLMSNMVKAYEFGDEVTDLNLYPLISTSNVAIDSGYMLFTHTTGVNGLQYAEEEDLIPINNKVSYEVSFFIESLGDLTDLSFGVSAFNSQIQSLQLFDASTGTASTDNLFLDTIYPIVSDLGVWVRGVVYGSGETDLKGTLNIGVGNNLKFNTSCEYICPKILIDNSTNSVNMVRVKDIKVRPLALPYSLGQLSANNFIVNYLKNNSGKFENELNNIIRKELLPYNSNYQPIYLD